MSSLLPAIRPLPLKERLSVLWLEKGNLDVLDGAFVLVDVSGVRTHVPVGAVGCLFLEPGIRVSHAAVSLAALAGTLLVWVGEGGVRLYSAGNPGGCRADKLLHQARLSLDDSLRLKVVRKMYSVRFGEAPPEGRSIEQLRGIEGARVKEMYKLFARQFRVEWHGRKYDQADFQNADVPNRCLSAATASLYGITEAAILAAGYSPNIGFLHGRESLSFVYDIADLVKFETVVPTAFSVAAKSPKDPERDVRRACRDSFRKAGILELLIPLVEEMLEV